jgi:hypothetical protein
MRHRERGRKANHATGVYECRAATSDVKCLSQLHSRKGKRLRYAHLFIMPSDGVLRFLYGRR